MAKIWKYQDERKGTMEMFLIGETLQIESFKDDEESNASWSCIQLDIADAETLADDLYRIVHLMKKAANG